MHNQTEARRRDGLAWQPGGRGQGSSGRRQKVQVPSMWERKTPKVRPEAQHR